MNRSRETVAQALALLLLGPEKPANVYQGSQAMRDAGFKAFGRRIKTWQNTEKPALFLINHEEEHERKNILGPDKGTMSFMLVIFDDVSDPAMIPSQRLNNFLDAIDAALAPDNVISQKLTLGGTVQHCWVEGSGKLYPGDLDNQSVATYPVRVLVP